MGPLARMTLGFQCECDLACVLPIVILPQRDLRFRSSLHDSRSSSGDAQRAFLLPAHLAPVVVVYAPPAVSLTAATKRVRQIFIYSFGKTWLLWNHDAGKRST